MKQSKTKKINLPVIIIASLLGIVLTFVIIFSVTTSRPLDVFGDDYDFAILYATNTDGGRWVHNDGTETDRVKKLDKAMQSVQFSYMQAILEGKLDTAYRFERDDDDELVEIYQDTLNVLDFAADQRMIELHYPTVRTLTVEDTAVKYDTVRLIFGDSQASIARVRIFAFVAADFQGTSRPGLEDTFTTPFTVFGVTNKLMDGFEEILDSYNA